MHWGLATGVGLIQCIQKRLCTGFDRVRADRFAVEVSTVNRDFHQHFCQCIFSPRDTTDLVVFETGRQSRNSLSRFEDRVNRTVSNSGIAVLSEILDGC